MEFQGIDGFNTPKKTHVLINRNIVLLFNFATDSDSFNLLSCYIYSFFQQICYFEGWPFMMENSIILRNINPLKHFSRKFNNIVTVHTAAPNEQSTSVRYQILLLGNANIVLCPKNSKKNTKLKAALPRINNCFSGGLRKHRV